MLMTKSSFVQQPRSTCAPAMSPRTVEMRQTKERSLTPSSFCSASSLLKRFSKSASISVATAMEASVIFQFSSEAEVLQKRDEDFVPFKLHFKVPVQPHLD